MVSSAPSRAERRLLIARPCIALRSAAFPEGMHPAQLLACIGEQFTEGDEICGIVVNVRVKQDKLCVWTRSAANEAKQVCAACVPE